MSKYFYYCVHMCFTGRTGERIERKESGVGGGGREGKENGWTKGELSKYCISALFSHQFVFLFGKYQ